MARRMLERWGMKTHTPTPHAGRRKATGGFTFVEVLLANLVVGLALGAVMEANSVVLALARKSHDINTAMLYGQERVEQIRNQAWPDMTSPGYYTSQYFAAVPSSAAGLAGPANLTETVTVEPYGIGSSGTALIVQSTGGAAPTVVQQGAGLQGQLMARVRINLTWTGQAGRTHQHEVDTVISSSSGITAASLPAMGIFAGGVFDSSVSSVTPTGGTVTTVAPTGNNGNGKGQGNIGGKTGQG